MLRSISLLACCLALLQVCAPVCGQVQPVGSTEAQAWLRYAVPLPKTIAISGKIECPPSSVAMVTPVSSEILVNQARAELLQALHLPANHTNPPAPAFRITLVLGGSEAAGLVESHNSDQASLVTIEPGNNGIRLVALEPAGLYYAAKTLQQLVLPYATGTSVVLPLFTMTDWPDIADRGVWGSDHFAHLRWMGDRKMNIGEQISARSVSSDGVGHSSLKEGREPMVTEGPYYNVQPVPATLHLEQVWGSGLFTYYPQVIGTGGQYGCICYSDGAFTHVLADWICDLASLPHVDGVDVWMAENLHGAGGCRCSECLLFDRDVLEAQVIVDAWEEAKTRLGRYIKLWILTSEETYQSNAAVFNAIPDDVRVWYYESLRTYTAGRAPMIGQDVLALANEGRYAGVCPSISYIGNTQPFQSAEFVNYRMTEFASKGLSGLLGYATPAPMVDFCGYNLEAAAEWSWNSGGRSLHEFALSYAVRRGLDDPETFAQWADAIGKLEFDLYGSEWPACEGKFFPGYVADLLEEGDLPALGTAYATARGPWGEFKTPQQLDASVLLAAKALTLAQRMGSDEYWYESLYVDGLVNSLRALYKLKGLVVNGAVSSQNRETARYYFGVYINSLQQSIDALENWCVAVSGDTGNVGVVVEKLHRAIYGDGETNPGMLNVANSCGCTPNLPYTAVPATSLEEAKLVGPGATVKLYDDIYTFGYGTTRYVQKRDRTSGIRLETSAALTPFAPTAVLGRVASVNGELVISAELAMSTGPAETVKPLLIPGRSIAGGANGTQPAVKEVRSDLIRNATGLNTIGLYIRLAGRVTYVGDGYFYLDDGAGCNDDSGHRGVRVICADTSTPLPQQTAVVQVDGVASTYYERNNTWRAIYLSPASGWRTLVPARELILDEQDAVLTGIWTYVSASGAWENDYRHTSTATSETATATWTPDLGDPGLYDVYVMYSSGSDRPSAASFTVHCSDGAHSYSVNQTSGGGAWQLLGRHVFSPGTSGYVRLSNSGPVTGKKVIADAVRFVYAGQAEQTPPHINGQPQSTSTCAGSAAVFEVSAWGTAPLTYQWRRGTTHIADGGRFSGAATSTLTIADVQPSDAGADYNCVVTNDYGSDTSTSAALTVSTSPAAPTSLAASVTTETIAWNWQQVPAATEYRLWSAASGGTQIGGSLARTSFTETGLDISTVYTRYVEAVNSCGTSPRTELTATTAARYCLENGGFESGFTAGVGNVWRLNGSSGTFAEETTRVHTGSYSQRITDAVGGDPFSAWMYQKVTVRPGANYSLSAYTRRQVDNGTVVEMGINYNGGLTSDIDYDCVGSAGEWRQKGFSFTAGAAGKVTVMFRAGSNAGDTTAYLDSVYLRPQAPTSTGGAATIPPGGSATLTASGGFGGTSSELHWYTGAKGTGVHVGTGTSLLVKPAVTTTYYPRWEAPLACPSDDGAAVTVTVSP